jgi:glycosyltransferase involved in cell wall biosynthesis
MKIAQLHPYPPELPGQIPLLPGGIAQGGSETSSFHYAFKLAQAGHDVTYYVAKYPGITVDELRLNDHFRIVYLKTIFKNVGPAFSFRLLWELVRGKYDVIQSHQIPTNFSLFGGIAARLTHTPFIITFHGRLPAIFLDSWVGTLASMMAKAVTVQNQYAYDLVKGFVPNKKLVVIPHGIDTDLFHKITPDKKYSKRYKPAGHKVIFFVGRMIPAKGVDVLLEAHQQLVAKDKHITLVLAGNGPQRAQYEAYARELGIARNVIFAGAVQQADLPHLYALADVFVLPSSYHNPDGTEIPKVSENFGLVIAEAMSCETPVVAANVGGIPRWVTDGKVARLFAERDATDLASKLDDALFDRTSRNKRLVTAAKHMIDTKYSWEAVIRQFTPLFRK